jgi:hypothetical protein
MNLLYILLFILEIIIVYMLFKILFTRWCSREDFQITEEEPKLKQLQLSLDPLFQENVDYSQTILENIMTMQTRKRILNEISLSTGKKSYTINKENIFLCLKDENNQYYEDNMLKYVLLHEISHSICDEIGHTQKFNDIFQALLKKAIEMKIYDPNVPIIKNYCLYNDKQQ